MLCADWVQSELFCVESQCYNASGRKLESNFKSYQQPNTLLKIKPQLIFQNLNTNKWHQFWIALSFLLKFWKFSEFSIQKSIKVQRSYAIQRKKWFNFKWKTNKTRCQFIRNTSLKVMQSNILQTGRFSCFIVESFNWVIIFKAAEL